MMRTVKPYLPYSGSAQGRRTPDWLTWVGASLVLAPAAFIGIIAIKGVLFPISSREGTAAGILGLAAGIIGLIEVFAVLRRSRGATAGIVLILALATVAASADYRAGEFTITWIVITSAYLGCAMLLHVRWMVILFRRRRYVAGPLDESATHTHRND